MTMSNTQKTVGAVAMALPLVFTGCAGNPYMPASAASYATQQERDCHKMASDGKFMQLAERSLYGAAGGAALGAVLPGVSMGQGAGVGAAATAITTLIQQQSEFQRAFNACMQNSSKWTQEYNEYERFKMQQQPAPQQNNVVPPARNNYPAPRR